MEKDNLMNRIICIGNKFVNGDDFGPRVFAYLLTQNLPDGIEVIDGGLMGLNLLRFFDDCERLVFVDSINGDIPSDEILVLENASLDTGETSYTHASGLGYLLQADQAIRTENPPQVFLIGAGAQASEKAVAAAAERSLQLVMEHLPA